ncbi:hypothetical protein ANCDUO_22822 [Ancylostoma duodenale]|uniref:Amino acid permease/ SLC12A domain-containing protein n=1 Tax=Ancylostoma duodenale TaxID=51022 RepID=A0A0C2FQA1_9BILA|nr:hypothetical protein ANCDUO_22822 [Ancylostoma duodenale]
MLAMVCGLGMGVMAALLLTMNVFAEFAGPGTIGLPRAMKSWYNSSGYQPAVLTTQFCLLLGCVLYCNSITGATPQSVLNGVQSALVDWFTLKWLRSKLLKKNDAPFAAVEEMEAEERRDTYT